MKARTSFQFVLVVAGMVFSLPTSSMYPSPPMPITKKYSLDRKGWGNLCTTTASIKLLVDPRKDSKALQEYPAGAIMVVIGKAKGTDYLYISPCNVCENGFALKSEFLPSAECA